MNKALYALLLIVTILATLGGFATLLPWEAASYPNVMGYSSLCTFAPAATVFCFMIAGLSCYFRASLVKDTEGSVSGRLRSHAHALAPIVLLLILGIAASGWFLVAKAQYRDTDTGATVVANP
jgi:hypothetical protein